MGNRGRCSDFWLISFFTYDYAFPEPKLRELQMQLWNLAFCDDRYSWSSRQNVISEHVWHELQESRGRNETVLRLHQPPLLTSVDGVEKKNFLDPLGFPPTVQQFTSLAMHFNRLSRLLKNIVRLHLQSWEDVWSLSCFLDVLTFIRHILAVLTHAVNTSDQKYQTEFVFLKLMLFFCQSWHRRMKYILRKSIAAEKLEYSEIYSVSSFLFRIDWYGRNRFSDVDWSFNGRSLTTNLEPEFAVWRSTTQSVKIY